MENNSKTVALIKIWHGSKGQELAPLGLLYVGNELKKAGYEVKVYQWDKHEALNNTATVLADKPFMVAFSMITGDPIDKILEFSKTVKEQSPETAIVFGGVHPTLEPHQCLEEEVVDYIVAHEGEGSIAQLADSIQGKRDLEGVGGVGYKKDGKHVINEFGDFQKNLDEYEMDWSLVDIEKYIWPTYHNGERVLMGYVASRGCPHSCAFCHNLVFNRKTYRKPTAQKVIDDINVLSAKHDFNGIVFFDDNFTVNKKWAVEVLQGIDLTAFHVETRIDYVTEKFIGNMYDSGVKSFFLGVESGSDRLLKLLSKGFNREKIKKSLSILASNPVDVKISLIVGVPTETLDEYRQTLSLVLWCLENIDRIDISLGAYLPYPGTPLYDLCVERGFEKPQKLVDWAKLDRWGHEDLTLPWTENTHLTSFEVKKLRNTIEKVIELNQSGKNGMLTSIKKRLLKKRIKLSGTRFIKLFSPIDTLLIKGFGVNNI